MTKEERLNYFYRHVVIYHNNELLVVVKVTKFAISSDIVLDWYAKEYGFERKVLKANWIDSVEMTDEDYAKQAGWSNTILRVYQGK